MYTKPEKTINQLPRKIAQQRKHALVNLEWLRKNMHPYLFVTLGTEKDSLPNLCMNLQTLGENHQLVLRDSDEKLIIATLNKPGTLFKTLNTIRGKEIIYAEMIHSDAHLPGQEYELEIQKFHFRTEKEEQEATSFFRGKGRIRKALQEYYPGFNFREFDTIFHYFLKKNREYVLLSPARRVARGMWLYQSAIRQGGAFLDIEPMLDEKGREQSRLTFSVIDPLAEGYIAEVIEIFYRLNIATRRNYVVEIEDAEKRVTILTAYIATRDGKSITEDMPVFSALESELYNTKVINPRDRTYGELVTSDVLDTSSSSLLP